ncbi:MAG: ATP-grasp domain-containing protein, partial [Alphaproteobacteria bacterium]
MFASVLIANRGEIACRIMRTARAMGMRSIAVYSAADRYAPHVRMADHAIAIGGPLAEESYLNAKAIIAAAQESGAQCIHPGYGFLAENAAFAEACTMAGISFVGPPVTAIRAMGRKDEAKALMVEAGVPVLPGYSGDMSDAAAVRAAAREIGFPVMIKAVAGGGGTGMRRVDAPEALEEAMAAACREAGAAFGDSRVILEKCLERPRHVEVQIFADGHGNCLHMFERDCSLQRRHQKVIEEAPAPGMEPGLRERMAEAAVAAASAVGYVGAGTVEFLTAGGMLSDDCPFYFLEMNTRLQVEHPVTEQVTGLDLVELQFRVAAGEPLGVSQQDIRLRGHAIEARIYAEDPERDFLPSSGRLHAVRWPRGDGIRIESGIEEGSVVSPYYDPMLAKLVATGRDRGEALARLRGALEATRIAGPHTNLDFLHALLGNEDVAAGRVDTGLIAREMPAHADGWPDGAAICAGVAALLRERRREAAAQAGPPSPWDVADGFSLAPAGEVPMKVLIDGRQEQRVSASWRGDGPHVTMAGDDGAGAGAGGAPVDEVIVVDDTAFVFSGLRQCEISFAGGEAALEAGAAGDGVIRAPMHGRI